MLIGKIAIAKRDVYQNLHDHSSAGWYEGVKMDLHIIISGLVQGVGYREWLRRQALAAGVTGWVRNRADGTVEAVLSGPSEIVEVLATEAATGPPGARVDNVRRGLAEASVVDHTNRVFFIASSH